MAVSAQAWAGPKEFYYQRYLRQHSAQTWGEMPPSAGTFQARINPLDPEDTRTFPQRYYVNSAYAKGANAPVLFYLCGEATCTGGELSGALVQWARSLGAHMVALEHRYYGRSQPFPTLTSENLKYLSTENALADAAAFERYAQEKLGLNGKWLVLGGSYAGSLSAFYRLKYPELVAGSLASSGPVRAKADFVEYDEMVTLGAGEKCAAAMREAVSRVEATLDDPARLAEMKTLFGASDVRDPVDFLYVIADMGSIAIQYGYKDSFCGRLTSGDPLQGYAAAGKQMFQMFGITAVQDSFQGAESLNPDDYLDSFGMRQWMWQVCTEYGYYQSANPDPALSTRSKRISVAYHDGVCDRLFGLKQPVDTAATNHKYYEPLQAFQGGGILMTNGSTDPWSRLSMTVENGNATNPALDYFTIEGAAHCDDLGSRISAPLTQARALFLKLARGWIQ
jgi:hypothetical protein